MRDWARFSPTQEDGIRTVNIHKAKTYLLRLLKTVGAGREVVTAKVEKSIAHLVPIGQPRVASSSLFNPELTALVAGLRQTRKKRKVTRRKRGRRMTMVYFMYPKKDGILTPASSAIALTMKLGPLPI